MPNVPTYPSEKVPLTPLEEYYHAMSTGDPAPEPQNREEWWLKQIADRIDETAESAADTEDKVYDLIDAVDGLDDAVDGLDTRVTVLETPGDSIVLHSSTEGSEKLFRITVDDTGEITATEIVEPEVPEAPDAPEEPEVPEES